MARALTITLAGFAGVLAIAAAVMLLASPGRLRPVADAQGRPIQGSISQKVRVRINGVEQGMVIRAADPSKPVLLFVHGGPGMPEYFLERDYPTGLEEDFVVCWWDQRGAGLSYEADVSAESMTVEQMVDDTIAVTEYLRQRFGRDKVYLMAHSWGTFVGIQAVERRPDLYHAYVGMGQASRQSVSEKRAYDYELAEFERRGDGAMVRKLKAAPVRVGEPLPVRYDMIRDAAMHRLGIGTTRDMDSVLTGIFLPSLTTPEYTLTEKVNLWRGKIRSKKLLWNEMLLSDLTQRVRRVEVPVYVLQGAHDYTTSYAEARAYFGQIDAPVKGFYTFGESAHTPLFEEPAKVRRILHEDVLAGETRLSDPIQ